MMDSQSTCFEIRMHFFISLDCLQLNSIFGIKFVGNEFFLNPNDLCFLKESHGMVFRKGKLKSSKIFNRVHFPYFSKLVKN